MGLRLVGQQFTPSHGGPVQVLVNGLLGRPDSVLVTLPGNLSLAARPPTGVQAGATGGLW